ncbi:MAG: hypothetical protein KC933_26885 [Myxococcales bacterium]|nr:hypothetical protein [Myxococcales bacterium]
MRPLLYKELLALRPYVSACLLLGLVMVVSDLATPQSTQGLAVALTEGLEAWLILAGTLAFAVGHAQVAPELTRGHIQLLDALPVSRAAVFVAKVAAGLVVVALILLVTAVSRGTFVALLTTDAHASPAPAEALLLVQHTAALLAFYGAGLFLSWLGTLGWAMFLLAFMVVFVAAEPIPAMRPLSLFHGYGTLRFVRGQPEAAGWPAMFWLGLGGAQALLSGLVFLGPGDALVQGGSRLQPTVKKLTIGLMAGVLLLLGAFSAVSLAARGNLSLTAVTRQVGHFRVLITHDEYRGDAEAEALLARFEPLDDAVRRILGVTTPLTLDVELAGRGRYHAGRYTGGKIRMAWDDQAAETFAHELTHAYAHALAGEALHRHHDHLRFFNEGLATWVAEQAVETSTSADPFRAWAGAIYGLDHHHFDPLTDDKARAKTLDPFEPYPLGLAFVEALVDAHGPLAPRCVLEQVALLPDQDLVGRALWYRVLAGCRFDLPEILAAYDNRLKSYARRWPSPARLVPVSADVEDGEPVLRVPEAVGVPLVCRFRSRVDAKPADLDEQAVLRGRCPVTTIDAGRETISYQLGWRLPMGWAVYTPWAELPVP